jgi:dimethylamine monooxygenase subunit A
MSVLERRMTPILQGTPPDGRLAQAARPLPGMAPLDPARWLTLDDAFAAQMAERERLIAERRTDVHALLPDARPAADDLLDAVLAHLADRREWRVAADAVTRPDGVRVPLDRGEPLLTLGRMVAEDFCLIQTEGGAHVLTGAILCFPADWTLAEKLGRPLGRIHAPVAAYDDEIARRVDRLFHGLKPGRPLWRANALAYDDPALFQPRSEAGENRTGGVGSVWLRAERQCLVRLPVTGAVAFSIHTAVTRRPTARPGHPADPQA